MTEFCPRNFHGRWEDFPLEIKQSIWQERIKACVLENDASLDDATFTVSGNVSLPPTCRVGIEWFAPKGCKSVSAIFWDANGDEDSGDDDRFKLYS